MQDVIQNIRLAGAATVVGGTAILPHVMTIGTSIGTFFAPNTAAAAGGAAKVIAASFSGSLITLIPASFGILIAGGLLLTGLNCKNQALINAGIFVGLLDVVGTYIMAAKIGATITGAVASSVMICNAIGAAVMLLALAVVVGTLLVGCAALVSSFVEAVSPSSLRR